MRKIIGIGETVLDIVFKDNQPIGAFPGGSVLNAMISLGRAGVETIFISEAGNDRLGEQVIHFLQENNINTSLVNRFPNGQSPISLAFLDKDNNAEYLFYKNHQQDHLDFVYPDIQPDDIVIVGSYFAVNPAVRPQVMGLLDYAHNHGAIIYYDVNYRPAHRNDVMKITPNLLENYEYADFVRGSREDFETLYHATDPDKIYNAEISFYCKKFILTQGKDSVEIRAEGNYRKSYPVQPMETVSTIGAGDNFNAGFLYGLLKGGITRAHIERGLTADEWDKTVAYAQLFSAECCKHIQNYVSKAFGESLKG